MAEVYPIGTKPVYPAYNAIKINIGTPNINAAKDENEYNIVAININYPNHANEICPVYSYPKYDGIVPYEQTGLKPVSVPQPNLTTHENEKLHKLSFRGKQEVEIIPDGNIKPAVDTNSVLKNLASIDYDEQALQMEKIAKAAIEDSSKAIPYITSDIFTALIDIVNKDTEYLDGPAPEQIEIRKKIIINSIIAEQMAEQGQKIDEKELPYQITQEELSIANELSNLELAERNKEYGIYTLATLAKAYSVESEKQTGRIVQLTDLPGANTIVGALRNSKNPAVCDVAINALVYLERPEYNNEIISVLEIVASSRDDYVGKKAQKALSTLK